MKLLENSSWGPKWEEWYLSLDMIEDLSLNNRQSYAFLLKFS